MLPFRMMSIPVALLLTASAAGAQRWSGSSGGSGGQSGHGSQPAARPASGAAVAYAGTPSKWGGSPPAQSYDGERGQQGFTGQPAAYIPVAVAAPYPVPAYADTACTQPAQASVEMPVITTRHEDRQLTTIEVYRLQPRFQKP